MDKDYLQDLFIDEVKGSLTSGGSGGGTSAPSDWNAKPGEPGHVLNRTHWKEEAQVIIEKTDLHAEDFVDNVYIIDHNLGLKVGATYTLNIWIQDTLYGSVSSEAVEMEEEGMSVIIVPFGDVGITLADLSPEAADMLGVKAMIDGLASFAGNASISVETPGFVQPIPTEYLPTIATNLANGSAEGSVRNIHANEDIGECSFAEGYETTASGNNSHAEGYETKATGSCSHAEGSGTEASGMYSHAEGHNTKAIGYYSHAEGFGAKATGSCSHAEGLGTEASGDNSHAEGSTTTASGDYSHAEGLETKASDMYSHAEGHSTTASGECSHAEGYMTRAEGNYSHVEGYFTSAGNYGHAEGYYAHAGHYAHAEGNNTNANGGYAHAEGTYTTAGGSNSHAEGFHTIAGSLNQHVQGRYNIEDNAGRYAHIVGNGTDIASSNAHTLDWDGNAWFAGTVEGTALILTSPNGTRYNITVGDDGTLSATAITES